MRTCGSESTKSVSALPTQIPFNLGVLNLGGHRRPSLRPFYNGVKKLARFEFLLHSGYFINVCECFNLK